jgi:hypothetical protein
VPAHGSGTFTLTAANSDRLEGTHGTLTTSGTGSTEESTTLQFHTGQVGF